MLWSASLVVSVDRDQPRIRAARIWLPAQVSIAPEGAARDLPTQVAVGRRDEAVAPAPAGG